MNVSFSPGNDEVLVVEELIGCPTSFEPLAVVAVTEDAFVGITWLKSHFSPLWHLPRKKNWQTRGKGISQLPKYGFQSIQIHALIISENCVSQATKLE